MGTTIYSQTDDKHCDMEWANTENGIVHLRNRIPLEILYEKSHNSGLIGQSWKNHHLSFAKFISEFRPKKICEIGGGHGILSTIYSEFNDFVLWEIFEPNPSAENTDKIFVRNELFSENSNIDEKDCFIHSHLFEHLYDHSQILQNIRKNLTPDGIMIFSVPNMRRMVKKKYINALNFEHVTYLPEDLIDFILGKNGFKTVKKEYFLDDHSIFYACVKSPLNQNLRYNNTQNIHDVKEYYDSVLFDIGRIKNIVDGYKNSRKIYIFGAHIFSQFYLVNGLHNCQIDGVLDNDKRKQGQRLYGSNLSVFDPEVIVDDTEPIVIMKVGSYKEEIAEQLIKLNNSVSILE